MKNSCTLGYIPIHSRRRHLTYHSYTPGIKPIIMRLFLTGITICAFFIGASAFVSKGQQISINVKNVPLKTVFDEIKKQTGYHFFYEDEVLKNTSRVSIALSRANLREILDACIKDQPISYTITDKIIAIKAKEKNLLDRLIDAIKAIDIRGKVIDQQGQPLPGATIKLKAGTKQATTNNAGEFYLENVPEGALLEVSYLGYITQELKAQPRITITLITASENLQEVQINAGYYTVSQRELTGSIAKVDSKAIAQQPVSNAMTALIGRMPGVNIEQQSGVNGGGFRIEIRGQNSLRNTSTDNGNFPLYLIDGVPFPANSMSSSTLGVGGLAFVSSPLSSLNPNDIESIEILKDADATAIYGSRGANGVVLITTKKAKQGRANYQFTIQQGASQVSRKLNYMNTEQYLAMRDEAFKNDGVTPNATQYDVNGTWDRSRYTDWQDALIGGTAHSTNINGSISGGNEYTQYNISGNYSRNTTVLPVDFADNRANGALSINHISLNKRFTANFYVNYAVEVNELSKDDLTMYINLPPNAPELYNPDGTLNWGLNSSNAATWTNPLQSTKQPYTGKTGNLMSSGRLGYKIIPGLELQSTFGYNTTKLKETVYLPIAALAPSPSATGANRIAYNNIDTWIIEPQLKYDATYGKGKLNVLAGTTFQATSQATEVIAGSGYTSDLLIKYINAAPTRTAINSSSQYRYAALFGRINYVYDSMYILNLTARRDGSSRFGPDRQFANFGAVGAAWIFSEYGTVKRGLPFISFGKLRASYGVTGSDQIQDYGYLETYVATNPYVDGTGLFPSQLANPDYSWEKTKKLEVGLELGLFEDKIRLATAFYQNRSSNQLVGYRLPDITGFSSIQYNLPATVQNKGWEFEIATTNVKSKTFQWQTGINFTIPRSKLLAYPGLEGSTYATTYTIGASLYRPRLYRYVGVNPNTGAYSFEDLDNNGNMTVVDRQLSIKDFTSHWFGGVHNSLTYKNLSLDFLVQAVSKTVKSPYSSMFLPGTMLNQTTDLLNRWQKPGDNAEFARYSQINTSGNAGTGYQLLFSSDRYTDASFVRLKNVSLSYLLPQKVTERMKITGLRFFVQGQNLITLTKYPGDPEVVNFRILPSLRTISAGLTANL